MTRIEFEIETSGEEYLYIREVVKKICEDHEGKRDLHIKIKIPGVPLSYSEIESLRERKAE